MEANYPRHLVEDLLQAKQELDRQDLPAVAAPEAGAQKKTDKPCGNPGCEKRGKHRCSGCLAIAFCSRNCSVLAWPEHKKICKLSQVD